MKGPHVIGSVGRWLGRFGEDRTVAVLRSD